MSECEKYLMEVRRAAGLGDDDSLLEWVKIQRATPQEPEPEEGERRETGPMQEGDDWPGVYFRGDDAAYHAVQLRVLADLLDSSNQPQSQPEGEPVEELVQTIEVAIDQLVYARQNEWSSLFGINRLKLRDLIVEVVRPYLHPSRDREAMRQRDLLWCKAITNCGVDAEQMFVIVKYFNDIRPDGDPFATLHPADTILADDGGDDE